MNAKGLSVLIPSRNEMFLSRTIENILTQMRGDTEVIAVLDGEWADPPIPDNPRVHIIYHSQSIGQRAATNEAARLSKAEYIMKCDAHCAFDEGFDVKLMADCEPNWTVIPRMYNLHAFDWQCKKCGHATYQGPKPHQCEKCKDGTEFEMVVKWEPRWSRKTDFARFDNTLHFQYWGAYGLRPEVQAQGDIADVMCCVGACWFMRRKRYWEIDGMDEKHGSWGQMGVELACKTWLSGGRQVVNKKTWFAHLFRTQKDFSFPYPLSGRQVENARQYSRDTWRNNKWPKQVHKFQWLIDKFAPIPDWPDSAKPKAPPKSSVALLYYTDNHAPEEYAQPVRARLSQLAQTNGFDLVSVSQKPLPEFGRNIHMPIGRSHISMFRQILAGLEAMEADIVFFVEHDVLYHPTHFEFRPLSREVYFYNEHTYKVDAKTGQAVFYYCKQTSGLCAYRELLLEHYRRRVAKVEKDGYSRHMGFEPGCHSYPRGVDSYRAERWMSRFPNVDIRTGKNWTKTRWDPKDFRNKNACLGWTLTDEVPGWGVTKGRFDLFLQETALWPSEALKEGACNS